MAAWGNALGGWRKQRRDTKGRFTSPGLHSALRSRGGGFVPYRRHGLGHNTIGLNAGARVSKNRRVSFGFYVRTDTDSGQKRASKIAKAQEHAQLAAAGFVPTVPGKIETTGAKLREVKKIQNRALRAATGGERRGTRLSGSLGTSYTRSGTDRNSLPTIVVRYNSPKDKRLRSKRKRNKAVATYNVRSVTGKRTYDWTQKPKKSRPQRRKKASS